MRKYLSKICTPAKIYLTIATIASILALFNGVRFMFVVLKLIFALIWTFALGWLCDKGFSSLSWVLVLLPYIFIALALFGIYEITHEHRQLMRSVKFQGAYGREPFRAQERERKMM